MQPTGTVWTTLAEDHPGIIPVKFGQNPMSGFREEVVWMKKFTHTLMDDGHRTVTIAQFEHFVLRWAKKLTNDAWWRTKADHNSSPWGTLCSGELKRDYLMRYEIWGKKYWEKSINNDTLIARIYEKLCMQHSRTNRNKIQHYLLTMIPLLFTVAPNFIRTHKHYTYWLGFWCCGFWFQFRCFLRRFFTLKQNGHMELMFDKTKWHLNACHIWHIWHSFRDWLPKYILYTQVHLPGFIFLSKCIILT